MPLELADEKAQYVIPFILKELEVHQQWYADRAADVRPPPFILGMNGVQGAGKTILVSKICEKLRSPPYNLPTVVFSVDDLYLTHEDQLALAAAHPENELVQHRGVPGTHDIHLAVSLLTSLVERRPTRIPTYDKALFQGQGDRTDPETWQEVNQTGEPPIAVVIFEGWCVAFTPLDGATLKTKWEASREKRDPTSRLWRHDYEHIELMNKALSQYNLLTNRLNAVVHIDAAFPLSVYEWRLQQEVTLRQVRGAGMTDDQVRHFVDGYYPAYELYTEGLRQRVIGDGPPDMRDKHGSKLRLVVGSDRRVLKVERP